MANVTFNQEVINSLADMLDTLNTSLGDEERELLIAIFAAAVGRSGVPSTGSGTLPATDINPSAGSGSGSGGTESVKELKRRLLNSYIPGSAPYNENKGWTDRITGPPDP